MDNMEGSLVGDIYSICHGIFNTPYQANCSHWWFCGNRNSRCARLVKHSGYRTPDRTQTRRDQSDRNSGLSATKSGWSNQRKDGVAACTAQATAAATWVEDRRLLQGERKMEGTSGQPSREDNLEDWLKIVWARKVYI